jgi:uncharacterized protein YbjQ (UPF0145 family)
MALFHRHTDEERRQEAEAERAQHDAQAMHERVAQRVAAGREQREADAEASQERVEQGGIPISAERRLKELRGDADALFTSDLSIAEFAVGELGGLEPITQVMGSSIYQMGFQWTPSRGFLSGFGQGMGQELRVISEAWNEARRKALDRLEQEAALVGADAVVAVRVQRGHRDWAQGVEFIALGTAVRDPELRRGDRPVLTDLSGQDYFKLRHAGLHPCGFVAATAVFYIVANWQSQRAMRGGMFGGGWRNQELGDFTRGVYDARETALARVQREAHDLHAGGVVGVRVEESHRIHRVGGEGNEREDLEITFHVAGTAIAAEHGHGRDVDVRPAMRLERIPAGRHPFPTPRHPRGAHL